MNLLRVFLVLSTALLSVLNTSSTQKAASQEKGQPVVSTIQSIAEANSTATPDGVSGESRQAGRWKYDAQTGQFTGLMALSPQTGVVITANDQAAGNSLSAQGSSSDLGPNDEQEPNETPAQANPLAVPGTRTGHAMVGDAFAISVVFTNGGVDRVHDLFAVTLPSSTTLDLTLTFNNTGDLDLFLFGSPIGNQVPILASSTSPPGITTEHISMNLAAGTYYVGVSA